MFPNRSRNTAPETSIIGVDDGSFSSDKRLRQRALLVAVLFRNLQIADIRVGRIVVDGRDANGVLGSLLKGVRFDVTMLSGISFGGFNLVDIELLARATRKPVIAISGDKPDNVAVHEALRTHFSDWKERWRAVKHAGRLHSVKPIRGEPALYFEVKGATAVFAKKMICSTSKISRLPEPIRVARILARSLSRLSAS
jgi:endonuclease V-like protein UPF0215 family